MNGQIAGVSTGTGNTDTYKAGDTLYYFYDHNGRPFLLLYNGEPYYYILNLQGDVYRLVDSKGTTVAQYRYDPWGKVLEATGSLAESNPLRYRGYYYDSETDWYYLNSRYYDPGICRFINADAVGILTQGTGTPAAKNLFAYCDNNPMVRKDDAGTVWETVFDVITLGVSIADVAMHPEAPWAWACLGMDIVDLIPFVTGVGEITRGARMGAKAVDEVADAATDVARKADLIGCFVAGTPVKTLEGEKPIEEIEAGDLVYAKNPETGECGYKKVVRVFTKEKTVLIHVRVGEELIKTTTEHPFWVEGYGFKAAEELVVGDYVENANGELLLVESVEKIYPDEPVTVYNFEVEDWHTYYVSEEEILVHNMCAMTASVKGASFSIKVNIPKNVERQVKKLSPEAKKRV